MAKRRGLQKHTAEVLQTLGFTAIGGTRFTRQVGEQLHFAGLQYGGSSQGFTFNLGCHFRGVPSMLDYQTVKLDDMQELDSGLRCRIGNYVDDGLYDIWWDSNDAELPAVLTQASWAIERAFNDCQAKWGDGKLLLQSHVKNRAGAFRWSRAFRRWTEPEGDFKRFAFAAVLAHRHRDIALARALYEKALLCKESIIASHVAKLAAALGIGKAKRSERKSSG
jgi:hypothetical protein